MNDSYLVRYRNVTVIIILSVIFGFSKGLILARMLSIRDFGIYSLSLTIIGLIYPLLLFGQQKGFIRFFVKNNILKYDWKRPIINILYICFLVSSLILPIISWYYDVGFLFFYFCLISIASSLIIELLSNVVRSAGFYEIALLLQRTVRIIIALTALAFFLIEFSTLSNIFLVFGTIQLLYALFVYFFVINKINIGSKIVPSSAYRDGLYFSAMDIISLANTYGINLIIASALSIEYLGAFFAVSIILKIYETFVQSTDFVVMPSSGQIDKSTLQVIMIKNVLIGVFISFMLIKFGNILLSYIYAKKYDDYLNLIPIICLLGIVKMMDIIPTSIISGTSNKKALKKFLSFNIIITLFLLICSFFSINQYGLAGAIFCLVILYSLRSVFGFWILRKKFNSIGKRH